jgi:single-stranded DNA-binding protein
MPKEVEIMPFANSVQFSGNLVALPVQRVTSGGKAVTYGRMAVDILGQDKQVTGTLWISLTSYAAAAAILAACAKGTRVAVEGRMEAPEIYTGADGVTRASLRVIAFVVEAALFPAASTGRAVDDHEPAVEVLVVAAGLPLWSLMVGPGTGAVVAWRRWYMPAPRHALLLTKRKRRCPRSMR